MHPRGLLITISSKYELVRTSSYKLTYSILNVTFVFLLRYITGRGRCRRWRRASSDPCKRGRIYFLGWYCNNTQPDFFFFFLYFFFFFFFLLKKAATIKRALNLGSDQEWAVDIGKPVKEAWAVSSQVHWFALVWIVTTWQMKNIIQTSFDEQCSTPFLSPHSHPLHTMSYSGGLHKREIPALVRCMGYADRGDRGDVVCVCEAVYNLSCIFLYRYTGAWSGGTIFPAIYWACMCVAD